MMSARLFRREVAHAGHGDAASRRGFYRYLDESYTRALTWSLEHRRFVAIVSLLVIVSGYPLYQLVRQEFVPSDVDEAEFELSVTAPEGTSMAAMDEIMRAVEADVRGIRGVTTMLSSVGGGFANAVNEGQGYVRIAPHDERVFSISRFLKGLATLDPLLAFRGNYTQRDVMMQIRSRLRKYRDLRVSVRNIQGFNIGGGNWDIDFVIRGPELERLAEYANRLRERAPELGVIDADVTLKLDKPEIRVEIDRERAADLGIRTQDIAAALRLMVGGDEEVTRFRDRTVNEDYDVQLRLGEADRNDPATIERLYVPRSNGELVRLDSVVTLVKGESPSRVDRLDRQRQVSLRAGVAPGFALADRLQALREAAAQLGMPSA
jgi:HAE1 family hydrophobic/amphiphilic exporter-1